jgi:hypothetical protein
MNFIKVLGRVALASTLVLLVQINIYAQDTKPTYIMVTLTKVEKGKGADYEELIKTYGAKMFNERVKSGELESWALYSVGMRTDMSDEYNYVSVAASKNLKGLMEPQMTAPDMMKKIMPGATQDMLDDIGPKYNAVRTILGSMILVNLDGLQATDRKFYEVNYMQVPAGKEAEYVALEKDIYKPLHKERMAKGEITGWGLYAVAYPYSDMRGFNYVTANAFNDWEKMLTSDYAAAYKKVFPKGDMAKVNAQTGAARKMYKTETWRLITRVEGK